MSEEDLERYEAEIELALVQEYRTVLPLFNYVVESERRFYLANEVKVTVRDASSPTCVELELDDAWVWDMYRPARFVPHVRVLTFRDVNVERLPDRDSLMAGSRRATLGGRGEDATVAWYQNASYVVLDRNWRCRDGELDVVAQSADGGVLVFCEVKTRSSAHVRHSLRGRRAGQATPRTQVGDPVAALPARRVGPLRPHPVRRGRRDDGGRWDPGG